jgi:hypothetical protein
VATIETRLAELAAESKATREAFLRSEEDRKKDHDLIVTMAEKVATACSTISKLQEAHDKGHESYGSKVWQVIAFGINAVIAALVAMGTMMVRDSK